MGRSDTQHLKYIQDALGHDETNVPISPPLPDSYEVQEYEFEDGLLYTNYPREVDGKIPYKIIMDTKFWLGLSDHIMEYKEQAVAIAMDPRNTDTKGFNDKQRQDWVNRMLVYAELAASNAVDDDEVIKQQELARVFTFYWSKRNQTVRMREDANAVLRDVTWELRVLILELIGHPYPRNPLPLPVDKKKAEAIKKLLNQEEFIYWKNLYKSASRSNDPECAAIAKAFSDSKLASIIQWLS